MPGGVLKPFRKTVFVAPFDYLLLQILSENGAWEGEIRYDEQNIPRKKATRDDTWSIDYFLIMIQTTIQLPHKDGVDVSYVITSMEDGNLSLEIKEKKSNGLTLVYNKPCIFFKAAKPLADHVNEIKNVESKRFRLFCSAGKLHAAQVGSIHKSMQDT